MGTQGTLLHGAHALSEGSDAARQRGQRRALLRLRVLAQRSPLDTRRQLPHALRAQHHHLVQQGTHRLWHNLHWVTTTFYNWA